ncbi:Ribose/xylose/arabinose/galactoside ABC-type transport system, permease component [Hoeflea phototrophica DFL-43]|uniref:Ribose/xylose/arabinose/galactoside ABC-type transport system, permease component n=1 Tax=Hoeflea phototrophica (strain DSM 17068 / NCIMB 14078 / DFL-43) TaxID=411684 RepID=A9D044_HOEPD|nr:ABC transporter permease [Hoeflea phototrophica]EDQ34922.2 Ribose/xylose/arabinose/galactoside ABC-type transport system, permease component [Hoeflea phototrophica DFL-43]
MTLSAQSSTPERMPLFRRGLKAFVDIRELTLIALIVTIIIVMANLNPYFLSFSNFRAVAVGMAPTAIIVIGMAILLASGGFDLSVGSVMALSSTVVAMLLLAGVPIPVAVLGGLILGAIIGVLNGLLVTGLGINPLIATLGTMSIARGIALVLTEGFSVSSLPASFAWIGKADIGGFPVIVLVTILLVVFFDLAVRHTRFFRQAYFIGANEKAAMLSGIHVTHVRIILYGLTGVLAALAGVLLASRLMSGTPTAGNGIELQVLAAAVIGGASLRGGEGTILGAFLGVVFVALINNTMTMLAVSIYWQMIVIGGVLICAVALDMLIRSKRS